MAHMPTMIPAAPGMYLVTEVDDSGPLLAHAHLVVMWVMLPIATGVDVVGVTVDMLNDGLELGEMTFTRVTGTKSYYTSKLPDGVVITR